MTDFRLRSFLEVCRKGSFTRAAEALHVTQPAVTQHIRYLEDDLGHRLFDIRGRTVRLTAEGEALKRFAESVEADARRTRERIAVLGSRKAARFGATRTIGEFVMPRCLASWLRAWPHSLLSMTVDNTERLFASLESGELDFIFVEGRFNRAAYASQTLATDEIIAVCSPGNPLAGATVDVETLRGETLILRERGSGGRTLAEEALASRNLPPMAFAGIAEIGSVGAIKELVAAGAGIAFLYGRSVGRELAEGTLSRVYPRDFTLTHEYSFVYLRDSLYSSDFRLFFDHCAGVLGTSTEGGDRE